MSLYLISYTAEFVSKVNILLDRDVLDYSSSLETIGIHLTYHRHIKLDTEEELLIRISYPELKLDKLSKDFKQIGL